MVNLEIEAGIARQQAAEPESRIRRLLRFGRSLPWEAIGVAVVLAAALGVRVFKLATIPANMTADELGFLRLAWHILDGTGPGLFGFDGTPSPVLGSYPIAWTMKIFGDGVVGGRMCPVIESIGTLLVFYFLARQWLSAPASLVSMLLLSMNIWFMSFSRTTWTNMNAPLFVVCGALMLTLAIRKGNWYYYAGGGAFAALSLYGYFSGRLVIFFVLAYAPIALLLYRRQWRRITVGYAILGATCFLVFLPQIKPIVDNWQTLNRRVEGISIFNMDLPYYGEADMKMVMVRQGVWAARGFLLVDRGQVMNHGFEPRYIPAEKGLLDPFVRSGGTPDAARGLIVAPLMFLFVGLGIETLLKLARWMNRKIHGSGLATTFALTGLVFVFAGIDAHDYFEWIGSPGALFVRGPALAGEQFQMWKSMEQEAAQKGQANFNFRQWCGGQFMHGAVEDGKIVEFCHEVADDQSPACVQVPSSSAAQRDEKRKFDLEKLNAALLQYRAAYGAFPYTGTVAQPICNVLNEDAGCVLTEFLSPLPREPALGGCFGYLYASDGESFTLFASLENEPAAKQDCVAATGLPPAQYLYCLSYQAPPPPPPILIP